MKKIYFLLMALTFSTLSFAQQQPSITACKGADGSVTITFDASKNCTNTPSGSGDSLAKRAEIGFHSGINGFKNVIAWDAMTALKAKKVGTTTKFEVKIANPTTYYVQTTAPTTIDFVFNDGPKAKSESASTSEWRYEGKNQATSGCADFTLTVATLASCTSNSSDLNLNLGVKISANPMRDVTYLTFENPNSKNFVLNLSDVSGRLIRTYKNVSSNMVEIKRDGLASGLYFATLTDAAGKFMTQKLIVE